MRIQSNLNNKKDVNFKAIYAKDPLMSKKLGNILFNTGNFRNGHDYLSGSYVYKNETRYFNQMVSDYSSLLLKKGITNNEPNDWNADLFLTDEEGKLLEKMNDKIDDVYCTNIDEDIQKHVNDFLKAIGEIVDNAKPIPTEIIEKSIQKWDAFVEPLSRIITKNIFNG